MGTNPGHIRKQILNDLPYPRDENSPAFRRMVSQIHALITEALIPDAALPPQEAEKLPKALQKEPPLESLPKAQVSEMIGLLEEIASRGGSADIFALAHEIGKDFGSTLYLIKAVELLDLVDTPKQTVVLTELGKHFVKGDINVRKRMLHELFGGLRIVQMASQALRRTENLRLSRDELTDRMSEWLPNENPHELIDTLVSWGRFAEYFGYSDDTKEVYLDVGQEAV